MEVTEETVNQLKITLTEDAVTTLRVDFYHRNRKGNFRYHVSFLFLPYVRVKRDREMFQFNINRTSKWDGIFNGLDF